MVRLFDLQIVNESYYLNSYIAMSEKELSLAPVRGCIYDKNGVLLAYNELTHSVTIEDTLEFSDEKDSILNEIIANTITIIEENGDHVIDDFPIEFDEDGYPVYDVSSDYERERFLKDIYGTEELDNEEHTLSSTTAKQAYEYLLTDEKYAIDITRYEPDMILKIMRVRYKMSSNAYQKYISTTIAGNVSQNTVIAIKENERIIPGVNVKESTKRVYNNSIYFSHILGYTGNISTSQLEEFNKDGELYSAEDIVGKSGIELEMESVLQGTKGTQKVVVDSTGRVLETVETVEAVSGNDIYLTIDSDLQIAGYHILEQELAGILQKNIVNRKLTENDKPNIISIYEVYFQLINNNIIDMEHFASDSASDIEQHVFSTFEVKLASVLEEVLHDMTNENPVWMDKLTEEYQSYYDYIYDELTGDWGIIDSASLPSTDEKKSAWIRNQISLKEILEYYVSKNIVNLEKLGLDASYVTAAEIYEKIVSYTLEKIANDKAFGKLVYKQLIYNGVIHGSTLCMILYDQNVLTDKDAWYQTLAMGDDFQTYRFIMEKIKSVELTPQMLALDPCSGSLVVTDVNTGGVLALVTYPSYDNNMFSGYVDEDYWNQLLEDLSTPLYSRATLTRTAPGSTFKVLTAVAALEEKMITPYTTVYDTGEFKLIDPSVKCWAWPGAHGHTNVMGALEVSCNYFFCQMGYDFSIDSDGDYNEAQGLATLRKYGELFGLTNTSGIELDENSPLFSTENPVTSSIGQGSHSFTNIQLAKYVTTVASRGDRYKMTVLDRVMDSDGTLITKIQPVIEETLSVSESTWDTVWTGMRMMVQDKTSVFGTMETPIAGKTGTAQENLLRPDHGLFISFGPYPNPEIAVTAVIPNGGTSTYACEVTRSMYDFYYSDLTAEDIINEDASDISNTVISD